MAREVMERTPVTLLCYVLLVAGALGSPQKPGVAIDQGIVILPVDPCELLSNRRTGLQPGEGIDRSSLQVLALGCLSRAKREAGAPLGYTRGQPIARDTRGLFKVAPRAQSGLIYPGTKWCGAGNIARNFWDLGKLADEDRCCREHDFCPESISARQCSHGLCNVTPFTRSHCACDERFRRCLQALKSPAADTIGAIYFNVGNILCFAEDEEGNDLPVNPGDADILEERSGIDQDVLELWPNGGNNIYSSGPRQQIGCVGRPNCRYKFYTQRHYTSTADVDNIIPTAVPGPRIYSQERSSYQPNLVMDKRSGVENVDHQAAEFLSKFLHHILRSTGILRPRK